jgi:hypothetical protein
LKNIVKKLIVIKKNTLLRKEIVYIKDKIPKKVPKLARG